MHFEGQFFLQLRSREGRFIKLTWEAFEGRNWRLAFPDEKFLWRSVYQFLQNLCCHFVKDQGNERKVKINKNGLDGRTFAQVVAARNIVTSCLWIAKWEKKRSTVLKFLFLINCLEIYICCTNQF